MYRSSTPRQSEPTFRSRIHVWYAPVQEEVDFLGGHRGVFACIKTPLSDRPKLLRSRASYYVVSMSSLAPPLYRCVGFLYCTKIRISRPGHHSDQRSVHYVHKRFHCLIYKTFNTIDELLFALLCPEAVHWHFLTLLRLIHWEQELEKILST